jgi:6-pyruvoyltetrahydropterin/6-carboxytetrahydropterin synthase
MIKISCTRIIEFCYGHRLMGHTACGTLHGHSSRIHLFAEASKLDSLGRVIDFAILKEKVGGWIKEHWDHTSIFYEKDAEAISAFKMMPGTKKAFILSDNPTAENLASYLINEVCPKVLDGTGVEVTKIELWETNNCYATVEILPEFSTLLPRRS